MISCVYCGDRHRTADGVRECWQRQQRGEHATRPGRPARVEPAEHRASVDTTAQPHDAPPEVLQLDQRGPTVLGRNALVEPEEANPAGWEDAPRVVIGPAALAHPEPVVRHLRAARHGGEALVLLVEPSLSGHFGPRTSPRETESAPVHTLSPGFTFWLDELHALVFTNSFDARGGVQPSQEPPSAWVDHGPLRFLPAADGIPIVPSVSIPARVPPNKNATADQWHELAPLGNTTEADLAADQLAAVTHNFGSARIIAPAGSGKTRVLTERVRHLMTQWRIPADAICLVAFNKRAQVEMEQRTADLVGLQVRTLNSLSLAIANGTPPFAARPERLSTIDEAGVRRVLERFVKTQRRLNIDPLATWIDALSAVRLGMRDPVDVEADYGGDVAGLGDVYANYVGALRAQGVVDFDHQVISAIEVLLTDPVARSQAQRHCRVLLVDEFQDLTPAHLLLIRLLAGPLGSVFGVGDDDQTIYGYNGADPAWLIEFREWFPGAGDHPLEVNYRCPAGIVDGVDRLLRHNQHRVAKVIVPSPNAVSGGWSATHGSDPVGETIAAIERHLAADAVPSQIAVLARVNTTLAPIQVALSILGVPVAGGVGIDYAERTAVRAAFAWLRLSESDRLAERDLQEAVRRPSRKLHPRIRDWVSEQRDIDGLRNLAARLNNDKDRNSVESFADDLDQLRQMSRRQVGTSELLRHLIDDIGLGTAVSTLDSGRRGTNRSAQNDDLQAFGQLADLYDRHGDGPFENWLRSHLAIPRSDDGVVLSTVHRVKGQEWPFVIIHLADDDQFPHRLSEDDEEERRLFHVAITRASSEALIVSSSRPSPFVAELTTEPPIRPPTPPTTSASRERSSRAARDNTRSSTHPLADRSTVIAAPGVVLVDQGQEWLIDTVDGDGAMTRHHDATRRFPLGTKVETRGRQRGTLSGLPDSVDPASARAFDALRVYRESARNGKPAYVVFDDKTLAAIASTLPTDLDELADIGGVGPAKLEAYGDDVLRIVAESQSIPM